MRRSMENGSSYASLQFPAATRDRSHIELRTLPERIFVLRIAISPRNLCVRLPTAAGPLSSAPGDRASSGVRAEVIPDVSRSRSRCTPPPRRPAPVVPRDLCAELPTAAGPTSSAPEDRAGTGLRAEMVPDACRSHSRYTPPPRQNDHSHSEWGNCRCPVPPSSLVAESVSFSVSCLQKYRVRHKIAYGRSCVSDSKRCPKRLTMYLTPNL